MTSPKYRGYTIRHDPPPIPDRRWDWSYVHEDYDGAEDAYDFRCGHAASFEACKAEIDDIEGDIEDALAQQQIEAQP